MDQRAEFKFKDLAGEPGKSAFRKYRDIYYGTASLAKVIHSELVITLFGGVGGALGLFLRSVFYPSLFAEAGGKVVFGKNVTIRHPHKIRIGHNVIIDDNCVLDAKGEHNHGITIGDHVYIGRNTIVYTKNGDIAIGHRVNLSSNCQVFSSNKLTFKDDTVVGAYSYFLSGGEYDYADRTKKFSEQSGTQTKGELVIGANCWISAGVKVLDAACIGDHCVIGAGAVVTKPVPADSIAVGVPARVVKSI